MVWMSRCIVQVLMFICRHNVQVCGQLTSRQAHLKVQKENAFFIELMGKFNVWVVLIETFFKNSYSFPLACAQIKKTSPIYRNHTKSLNFCVSRKLVSISSIKVEAYARANFVPMAVPDIWCLTSSYILWSNGLVVVKALDSQSRGSLFKTTGWLQGRLSHSSFQGR